MDPEKKKRLEEKLKTMFETERRNKPEQVQFHAQAPAGNPSGNVIRRRKGEKDRRLPI